MLISELLKLPDQVRRGDFVLRLSEGVSKADETLSTYVVTKQLVSCFDQALDLVKSAVQANTSKGCYLHGSFGSGKSHFMAVLHLILQGNTHARSLPELASVIAKHNDWTEGKRFLLLPYHMIGKESMEEAILGGYADQIHKMHPEAATPGVYRAEKLLADADALRRAMGDVAFFKKLNERHGKSGGGGWGDLEDVWSDASFDEAFNASPRSSERVRLVGDLVDTFFTAARGSAQYVELGDGLAIISKHAKALGYHAVILFLDELILWLASRAADVEFVNREGPKLANLVEAQSADRPIPLVSFVARQRDLKELVGDCVNGADYLRFSDSLNWWEARFATIKLADRNLPAIAEKRVLVPRDESARLQISAAFEEATQVRRDVMDVLLTQDSDRDMFRRIYPFSPAFMDTLVEMSFLLQRERTALKVMLQILIGQQNRLKLGDIVPVGDLFDAIAEGDEAVSDQIKTRFDFAKRLYDEKFRVLLEKDSGLRFEDLKGLAPDDPKAMLLRNDDRLVKTLLLAALAPNVEALRGLTASRLAALNHGTIKSPIPGREGQLVLSKIRKWAAAIGQIKVGDDAVNPSVSVQLSEVDTDTIIDSAKGFDNQGNRIRKIRSMLFQEFGIEDRDDLILAHSFKWRATDRSCRIVFQNVRELPLHSFESADQDWTVVIDWPFDHQGHSPADDRAKLDEFIEQRRDPKICRTIVILPSFLSHDALRDLSKLVILDNLMKGDNFANHTAHLSPGNRETARALLKNQQSQLQQRILTSLENAYGISDNSPDSLDTSALVEGEDHFACMDTALKLRPPVAANMRDAFMSLLDQGLSHQYPAHPLFEEEVRLTGASLKRVYEEVQRATLVADGRIGVDKALRREIRLVANPLKLGEMTEQYFILGQHWKDHFLRKRAETGLPMTVENLRKWMDDPLACGLPPLPRNLVILVFAAQTNHSFFLHNSAVEASLEELRPEMELRTVDLPTEDEWKRARERAGHLFGVTATDLISANSVSRFSCDIRRVAEECRASCAAQAEALSRLWSTRRELQPDAPRLVSAQAANELVEIVALHEERKLVERIANWTNRSTDAAVGTSLKKANDVVQALKRVDWEKLEMAFALEGDQQAAALRLAGDVKAALEADEYAVGLGTTMNVLAQQATQLIRSALKGPDRTGGRPPIPVPQPEPEDVDITLPKTSAKPPVVGSKSVDIDKLADIVAAIQTSAKGFSKPKIEVNWKIYE